MTLDQRQPRDVHVPSAIPLLLVVLALVIATAALTVAVVGRAAGWPGPGMMSRTGMMAGVAPAAGANLQPGEAGFVAGSAAAPRVIRLWAGPGYAFSPSSVAVARGETVTFLVTVMGPLVHEFMVGPADAVAADVPGTPEVADLRMMQTATLTITFTGSGPYAFACHAAGHYEAGMRGTIMVVG